MFTWAKNQTLVSLTVSVSSMKAEWLEFSNVTHLFDILDFVEERLFHQSWDLSLRPLVKNVGTRTRCKGSIIDQFCRTLERIEKVCKNMKNSWMFQLINLRSRSSSRISIWTELLIQGIPIVRWNRANNTHELNGILSGHGRISQVPSFHPSSPVYVVCERLQELPIRLVPNTRRCKWTRNDQVLRSCRLPANFEQQVDCESRSPNRQKVCSMSGGFRLDG